MSESTMTVDEEGTRFWKNEEGKLHCINGPAIVWSNGTKHWYQNDLRHRLDGPAVVNPQGTKIWYKNGKLHRVDGPAIEYINGHVVWFVQGSYLGHNIEGFWSFWDRLDEEARQNVNLHMWLRKLTND